MFSAGLCSVTFRQLSAREIVDLCVDARLHAIEWGGDVHVPAGNLATARDVSSMCRDAGLQTPTYGSYFRVGTSPLAEFQSVLDSAVALGATTIRVWAGSKSSAEITPADAKRLLDETHEIAELAHAAKCRVAFEYHLGTATDTNDAALLFIRQFNHPAVSIYWQPRQGCTREQRLEGLQSILPFLAHLHVFHWLGTHPVERRPLFEGAAEWKSYLALAAPRSGDRCAFLEFVAGDDVSQFKADAAVLRQWLG